VDADANLEVEAARHPQLVLQLAQLAPHVERCVAGALRMVLVCDRSAEQGHDAVAGILIDRALVAVDAVRQHLEEAIQDGVPLLRIEPPGELHRPLHIRKEHRHLLALTFERRAKLEDAVGQVLRRVLTGVAQGAFLRRQLPGAVGEPGAALGAEALPVLVRRAAARAGDGQGSAASAAEAPANAVFVAACRALHARSLPRPHAIVRELAGEGGGGGQRAQGR
jgi:hypothetical protein